MKEKILIIEDDPLIRNELKTLMQSNGYETVAPEDFSDVIDRIKAEQPHLVLLDIKLPGEEDLPEECDAGGRLPQPLRHRQRKQLLLGDRCNRSAIRRT
jgi:CheY-like chemotaxis protein